MIFFSIFATPFPSTLRPNSQMELDNILSHSSYINVHLWANCALFTAAALYYLAELVEEYTTTAAKVIRYWIWVCYSLPKL